MWLAALIGALLAACVTVFALNFIGGEKRIERKLEHRHAVDDPQFRREIGTLLGPPILDGNRVANLENGAEIFPAMLDAIRQAKQTINFETYIYWSGDIGREFVEALAERARAGVEVQVLLDWVGSQKMDEALLDKLKAAGVQVERYHPLHVVPPRAHEQPHSPQAAGRRRPHRLHRRRRHRGQLGWQRRLARPLAGFALPHRGPRRRPDAGRVPRQLDQDHRRRSARRRLFSRARGRGRFRGAGLHRIAERRRRQHAAHVPDGDHGGRADHRPVGRLFRPR